MRKGGVKRLKNNNVKEKKLISTTISQLLKGEKNMSTYVPIITALKSGLIKPEEFVAYTPDEKRRMYVQGGFLFDSERKETEFDLGWHAIIYKGYGVLLVADKVTEATITVSSEYGINIKTLEDYANLYQNKSLHSIGVALTSELFNEIPESLRHDEVWVYSNTQKTFRKCQTRRNTYNPAIPHDHRRHYGFTYRIKHMQPTIFIPPDTIVEIDPENQIGKSKENGFKLHPRNSFNISKFPEQCLESANVPMWVPFIEAVCARAVLDTDFVEYVPNKASVSFKPEETNTENIQIAETEYQMGGWHPIVLKKGNTYLPYLVATHCSKFKLNIFPETDYCGQGFCIRTEGKNQFEIGIELLERYAKIYSSKELNAEALPFNEELFDALDWNLISKDDIYYLADTFTYNFHFAAGYPLSSNGLSENYEQRMGLKWIAQGLYGYKQCKEPVSNLSIRIAILLSENVMVQINNQKYDGSTEEKALKLMLASKEENN